jgi:hypothetical protein
MQHSELHDGKQTKQFQRLVHRLAKLATGALQLEKQSLVLRLEALI